MNQTEFCEMLIDALNDHLTLDLDFDDRDNDLHVNVYFDREQILSEVVDLTHEHKITIE